MPQLFLFVLVIATNYRSSVIVMEVESDKIAENQAQLIDEPRTARPTIKFINEYCADYRNLFMRYAHATRTDVRGVEAFKHLHIGMRSSTKRKSLLEISQVVGLEE